MKSRWWLINLGLFFLFLLDRIFKDWFYLTRNHLAYKWGQIFFWQNHGGIFGWPINNWWLVGVGIVGLVVLVYWFIDAWLKNQAVLLISYGLIIIGGFSNWFDRLRLGGVVDVYHWQLSIFNLADVYLLAGLLMALFYKLKH